MKLSIIFIASLLVSYLVTSTSDSDCSISVFLLAGQSNMAGRGGTYNPTHKWDKVLPEQCKPDPRILRLNNETPTLPIVQVALALPQGFLVNKVRRAQLELKLPNVTCIDAAGLPLNGDRIHLTTEAQVELGEMFANAFCKYF